VGKEVETSSVFSHLNCRSIRAVRRAEVHIVTQITHRKMHSSFAVCASLPTTAQRCVICNRHRQTEIITRRTSVSFNTRHFFLLQGLFYLTTIFCHFPPIFGHVSCYEGDSNKNLKYFLSRNLLNTKGTQ
jgi:hypothetical protein